MNKVEEKKMVKEWYLESYFIFSFDTKLVTHKEFMKIVILGK